MGFKGLTKRIHSILAVPSPSHGSVLFSIVFHEESADIVDNGAAFINDVYNLILKRLGYRDDGRCIIFQQLENQCQLAQFSVYAEEVAAGIATGPDKVGEGNHCLCGHSDERDARSGDGKRVHWCLHMSKLKFGRDDCEPGGVGT